MAEALVQDWLTDYENLQPPEVRSFCKEQNNHHEISSALFTILGERDKFSELSLQICNQFHNFYKSTEIELRRFTLQFVPVLIYNYLHLVSQGEKKAARKIETLLIVIYNIEISHDGDGRAKVISFRMPILAQTSIYHEEKNLQHTDLRRWEENCNKSVNWGPLPFVEHLNAQNRLKVMTALMFIYNQQLSQIHKPALYHLCRISSQLVNQGFGKFERTHRSYGGGSSDFHSPPMDNPPPAIGSKQLLPRIPVSSQFLLELAHATYFAMFNEFASVAIRAIKDIHNRACFEMLPDVILVTNAVKNSLQANPSGQPSDGPMGISVALTPATTTVTVSKSMITNASFRAKKLPDDIPIQLLKDEKGNPIPVAASSMDANQLQSINEDCESAGDVNQPAPSAANLSRNTPGRQSKEFAAKLHKVSFPNFKKSRDKESKNKNVQQAAVDVSSASMSSTTLDDGPAMMGSNVTLMQQPVVQQQPTVRKTTTTILKEKLINRNSVPSDILMEMTEKGSSKAAKVAHNMSSLDAGLGMPSSGVMLLTNSNATGNVVTTMTAASTTIPTALTANNTITMGSNSSSSNHANSNTNSNSNNSSSGNNNSNSNNNNNCSSHVNSNMTCSNSYDGIGVGADMNATDGMNESRMNNKLSGGSGGGGGGGTHHQATNNVQVYQM